MTMSDLAYTSKLTTSKGVACCSIINKRGKPERKTYHFSVAGAVAQAQIFKRQGIKVWVEGHIPATSLEKSRSPAVSEQLRNRRANGHG